MKGDKSHFLKILSVNSFHTFFWPAQSQEEITYHRRNQQAARVKMCEFFGWCTMFIYSVAWQKKNPDILLSVQGKHNLPLRGRCTNPLEKTSWGLRKEKKGGSKDERIPPHFPFLSPVNATTQVPLTSQEVDLCTGSVADITLWCWSRWQLIVVSSGGGGRSISTQHYVLENGWTGSVTRGEKKGESGVVCGLAIQGVDVGHRSRLWGQTVETECKASRLMYEHCWPFPEG